MDPNQMMSQALIVSGWGLLWGFLTSALLYCTVILMQGIRVAEEDDA